MNGGAIHSLALRLAPASGLANQEVELLTCSSQRDGLWAARRAIGGQEGCCTNSRRTGPKADVRGARRSNRQGSRAVVSEGEVAGVCSRERAAGQRDGYGSAVAKRHTLSSTLRAYRLSREGQAGWREGELPRGGARARAS